MKKLRQANEELRALLRKTGVTRWQIALKLGLSENTIVRKLRVELDDETRVQIENAVKEVLKERGE